MGKLTKSDSAKRYYGAYSSEKQRSKRLARHMKKHPNDGQAKGSKALHRRGKPNNKGGWMNRSMATLIYIGRGQKDGDVLSIMNSMTNFEKKRMAVYYAMEKAVHNRLRYQKNELPKASNLGYAG